MRRTKGVRAGVKSRAAYSREVDEMGMMITGGWHEFTVRRESTRAAWMRGKCSECSFHCEGECCEGVDRIAMPGNTPACVNFDKSSDTRAVVLGLV
jgi:hypothetical protein